MPWPYNDLSFPSSRKGRGAKRPERAWAGVKPSAGAWARHKSQRQKRAAGSSPFRHRDCFGTVNSRPATSRSHLAGRFMVPAVHATGVALLHFLIIGGCVTRIVVKFSRHLAADFAQPFQPVIMFRFHLPFPAVGAGSRARAFANPATH